MPGLKPDSIARLKPCARNSIFMRPRSLKLKAGLALGSLPMAFSHAIAHESLSLSFKSRLMESFHSTEILMLAVFCGAMSFALMSAFWLIRERNRVALQNTTLKESLSNLRAKNDRNEALINIPDQRITIWNGIEGTPILLGNLSNLAGAPKDEQEFLKFKSWLTDEAWQTFEPMLEELRTNATPFDLSLTTRKDGVLEVQGRTSGTYAFVRLAELGSEREEHSRLKTEHETLIRRFKTMSSLFEKMPIPIWLRDNLGNLSWINKAYGDALDLEDASTAIGTNWNLFDQEQRDEIEKIQETNDFYQGTLPATVAGDRKKLEVFSNKTEAGSAGIALDKSDVDEIRRTLNETNEGHSRVLDQLATAVVIFDKSQKLIFSNNGFRQLWKLDEGFLESNPSNSELFDQLREGKLLPTHPDWRKWRDEQLNIYRAIEPREEWWHLMDGQTIRVVATPRNEGGSTWVFENVTERLALESNYNSLIQVQGETLDHLNEAVSVFGSNGKLRLFNPALQTLWNTAGLEVAEGLHIVSIIKSWTDSVANPDDLQKILGKITGLNDKRSELQGRLNLRNGTTFEYSLVPLPEGQSMLTFSDTTANVNFEKALNERAEALEASDQLKSKFIQHVSYELRAPLTSISGFGEMLATPEIGKMNEKQTEYLSHINTASDDLRAMVDDILDLASIDAGSMTLDLQPVHLENLISDIFHNFEPVLVQRGLKYKVDITTKSAQITADQDRLEQVINNLISNAVNFSPDGGIIKISAKEHGAFHEIHVIDQGRGIAEDQREAIFDRFETQPHQGTRKGAGLGLSIVRGFIEMHGGSVNVENVEPNGACFICRIPLEPEADQTPLSTDSAIIAIA